MKTTKSYFENNYLKYFKAPNKIRATVKMGSGDTDEQRINSVLTRAKDILEYLFEGTDLWIKLIVWNKSFGSLDELNATGFRMEHADSQFNLIGSKVLSDDETYDSEALALYYKSFSFELIKPLVNSSATFELGVEPSANVRVYYLHFDNPPFLVNIYDDRGLEFICTDLEFLEKFKERYKDWIIEVE
jgi:hypothetical protein